MLRTVSVPVCSRVRVFPWSGTWTLWDRSGEGALVCNRQCECHQFALYVGPFGVEVDHTKQFEIAREIDHVLNEVEERVSGFFRDTSPPYLFPQSNEELMPGMNTTTVAMALEDVWTVARDAVLNIVRDLR